MAHQPYNTWLLDETKLTQEQCVQLENHLKTCSECQPVHQAWLSVKKEIKTSPMAEPAADFTARWKAYAQIRNTINQKQLAQRWLLGLSLGAIVTLILLVVQIFTSDSVWTLMVGASQVSNLLSGFVSQVWNVSWLLFHNASPWVWIVLGVGVASWIAISLLAGSFIVFRARRKEITNHEN